jgi:hypothetical protein
MYDQVCGGRAAHDSSPPLPPSPFSVPFLCSGVKSAFLSLFCLCKRERITTTSNIPGTHPHTTTQTEREVTFFHLVDILG